jgi:hypothetical protein
LKTRFEKIGRRLGVKQLDDWYKVTAEQVRSKNASILKYFKDSSLITAPKSHWRDKDNQRECLELIGKELGVKELDDWYNINAKQLSHSKISWLTNYYRGSLHRALRELYPRHKWDPLRFGRMPKDFWKDEEHQFQSLKKIEEELGIKELDDWYKISANQFRSKNCSLLYQYNGSILAILKKFYPNHEWNPLRFTKVPQSYWKNEDNQRKFLEVVGKELGVKKLDDWYKVIAKKVTNGRSSFIDNYYNGLVEALQKLYPEHNWDPLQFAVLPHNFWRENTNKNQYYFLFKQWIQQYNIKNMRDWYKLPKEQVKLFQRVVRGTHGTLSAMLSDWFPETRWIDQIQSSTPELELQVC